MLRRLLPATVLLPLALAACDSPTATGTGKVAIRFGTASAAGSASRAAYALSGSAADQLVLTGSNGTLTITDIRFIVSEFELQRAEGSCAAAEGAEEDDRDDDCEEFEAPPSFVDLPLGSGAALAATQEVPAGRYEALKFEVEDVDFDDEEDDDRKGDQLRALAQTVRAAFPDWPEGASMVVVGTFAPTGGAAVPFTAYFEAEIEVESEFDPALEVSDANRAVTVEVDPSLWFRSGGHVVDLSALDYGKTGKLVEFEAKMENGFSEVELDD